MTDVNETILHEFLIESFDNLSGISEEITKYENQHENTELLNSIYRKVHTLKGSASFLGLKKLEGVTHCSENILDLIREGELVSNSKIIDVLLESFDACLEMLKNIENTKEEGSKDYSELISRLEKVSEPDSPIENQKLIEPNDSVLICEAIEDLSQVENIKKDEIKDEIKNEIKDEIKDVEVPVSEVVKPVKEVLAKVKKVDVVKAQPVVEEVNTEEKFDSKKVMSLTDSVVRVNVQLLDKIMNVVGELVLNRNQILQYANNYDSSELNRLAQQLNVITTDLQNDIMTTRMQPVGSVLTKFERIVRDLSRNQGKSIKLSISGKETELDKTLLEAIRDPMTHLVRNSVDHGIETPENRVANGKTEEGNISIKSYHEGGQVTIEISDDGNGIDPEKILAKAVSKNVISKEKAETFSERQILNLIFTPGFSTAEQVTNISGRGVGMDVVKSNIEKIGGSVDVISEVGYGTSFKLKIPLTLAIVPALVIRSAEETFAIPQINLVELVRLEKELEETRIEKVHDSDFYRLRGELIPVFRLNSKLQLVEIESEDNGNISDSLNIVILNAEGQCYGLIVDNVLDTEEIVVKPLSRKLKDLNLFGGATIMGDGRVALIIDALGFFNSVDSGKTQKADISSSDEEANLISDGESQEILLTELGDKRNYGIPLCLVNRLEEFPFSSVEWTGEQPLVRYRNMPMILMDIEKALNLSGASELRREDAGQDDFIACVVVKIRGTFFGLVVKSIKDIAFSQSDVNVETSDRDGIMGTLFVNEKTVSLLDIHSLVDIQSSSKGEPIIHGSKILLVDDSPMHRRVQKEVISELGFDVILACDGIEAKDRIKENADLKLVITDLDMPNLNGWELVKHIRETNPDIPVVAMGSRISNIDEERSERSGFNKFVDKTNQEKVAAAILSCVG
ncbi:hypothetical protein A9Q84_18435 [Halobacteriovorax marinus]|uniref:histidine kinase n=1 Tax=Halobacteriovorax marinus TaxID=97084 RepID=A0A1Y5F2A7_9BACT|nr:hypothetical protein A9Q84_18435 [Halobacteriovorax marinus]